MAAPPTCPMRMASASASSSMMPPRATLTMRMPGLAEASRSLSIRPDGLGGLGDVQGHEVGHLDEALERHQLDAEVLGPLGRHERVVRHQLHAERHGPAGRPACRCDRGRRRRASCRPARRPPTSSAPSGRRPGRRGPGGRCGPGPAASPSCARRSTGCSTAAALTTITPRAVAASTSTLSRPMPARPTTTRSVPASSTSAVTCVAERMMSAAAPGTASSSSSGDRPSRTSTSWPASRSCWSPPSAIFSVTRMRAIARKCGRGRGRTARWLTWPPVTPFRGGRWPPSVVAVGSQTAGTTPPTAPGHRSGAPVREPV